MSPTRRRVLASAALLTGVAGCRGPPAGSDRSPAGDGPTGTATGTPDEGPAPPRRVDPEHGAVRWRVDFDDPVAGPPAVGPDAVYAATGTAGHGTPTPGGSSGGSAAALDPTGGAVRWHAALPAPATDVPLARGGDALVVTGWSTGYHGVDQRLRRLGPGGTERWRTDPVDQFLSVLAVGDDRAYLATNDDAIGTSGQPLFAVGLADGRPRWSVEGGDGFGGRLLDATLLADFGGVALSARDPADGSERWRAAGEPLYAAPGGPTVAGGAAFLDVERDGDGSFSAVDLSDGTRRWSYAAGGGQAFVPTGAAAAGSLVVGTEYGGAVFGLAAADGTERWTFRAEGETRDPPLVTDGTVYVGDVRGWVYALDPETGRERWRRRLDGPVGPLSRTGRTLVAETFPGDGEAVHGLDAADGAARWAFRPGESLTGVAVAGGTAYVGSESGAVRALGG